MTKGVIWAVLVGCLAYAGSATAAPGDIYGEVMGAPPGTYAPNFPWFTPGHAFVCITYDLASGIKEECYGFYPSTGNSAIVGAPNLANEFNKDPTRFSHVSWSLRKKISASQRQAFFNNVATVDKPPYALLQNNCGDFVHDAVDAFGWTNVSKGALPEPYVRDLVAANIVRFRILPPNKGTLTRAGGAWVQKIPTVPDRVYQDEHHSDETYMYIIDKQHNVELRLPLKGGSYDYNYSGQGWHNTGSVSVDFD